jgi:Skp family chaperone for outer membrane proteins
MRRLLVTAIACAVVILNLVFTGVAQAQPSLAMLPPTGMLADTVDLPKDLLQKLETEVLPQLETILYPEQREQFKTALAEGTSLRKAFKALNLTPEQKSQLGTLLKSLPQKDVFTSLTPEQKKQLFMKKKELFTPTSEEISAKISKKMKAAQTETEGMGEEISDKVKSFKPTIEQITEKISSKLEWMKLGQK